MSKIVIIGSGFCSGVLCKNLKANKDLVIFEKSRGPGGRSSSRRVKNIGIFDHGLQFIAPTEEKFELFLLSHLKNFIKEWKGKFVSFDQKIENKKKRYVGKLGNNDFVKNLINTKVHYQKELANIQKINHKWVMEFIDGSHYESTVLILTLPLEQCKKIIESLQINLSFNGKMEPNLTAMVAFDKKLNILANAFEFQNNPILAQVFNESSKLRSDNNSNFELWTLQSNLVFAQQNISDYKMKKVKILDLMINEFLNVFNIKNSNVVHKDIHGWLYAFNLKNFDKKFYWNQEINLGICGDWMCGSKAENAWSSASSLADQINNA